MNQICKILPRSNILLGLDASSKKRVFEQAGLLIENNHGIARATVYDALFAREKLGSTGLGLGVAIPHGRIKNLKQTIGALIRLANPVPSESPDGQPVALLFVLLVPESATEKHLQLLSELAQLLSDRSAREHLLDAPDAAAIEEILERWNAD